MIPAEHRDAAVQRIRGVIDRQLHDGTASARMDRSFHTLFPVGVSAAEGDALRRRVIAERVEHRAEIGLGYSWSAITGSTASFLIFVHSAAFFAVEELFGRSLVATCSVLVPHQPMGSRVDVSM